MNFVEMKITWDDQVVDERRRVETLIAFFKLLMHTCYYSWVDMLPSLIFTVKMPFLLLHFSTKKKYKQKQLVDSCTECT